jgi:hypothetical protein
MPLQCPLASGEFPVSLLRFSLPFGPLVDPHFHYTGAQEAGENLEKQSSSVFEFFGALNPNLNSVFLFAQNWLRNHEIPGFSMNTYSKKLGKI